MPFAGDPSHMYKVVVFAAGKTANGKQVVEPETQQNNPWKSKGLWYGNAYRVESTDFSGSAIPSYFNLLAKATKQLEKGFPVFETGWKMTKRTVSLYNFSALTKGTPLPMLRWILPESVDWGGYPCPGATCYKHADSSTDDTIYVQNA